jgi:hypothetical protein
MSKLIIKDNIKSHGGNKSYNSSYEIVDGRVEKKVSTEQNSKNGSNINGYGNNMVSNINRVSNT